MTERIEAPEGARGYVRYSLLRGRGVAVPRQGRPSASESPQRGSPTYCLSFDETVSFKPDGSGLVLVCRLGSLIVTQEGDPEDHVLGSLEEFRSSPRGKVVAWAQEESLLEVRAR